MDRGAQEPRSLAPTIRSATVVLEGGTREDVARRLALASRSVSQNKPVQELLTTVPGRCQQVLPVALIFRRS